MPALHPALDLFSGLNPIPQPGKNRNTTEVPARRARVVARATRIDLQMHAIHRARKLTIDSGNDVHPIRAVVKSIRKDVIAEVAQHDPKLHRRVGVEAVFVVEVDGIERRNGILQRLKILIKDAARASALRLTSAMMSCQSPTFEDPMLNVTLFTDPCFRSAMFAAKSGWVWSPM